ncbi:G2/M phase-specific E3 ubiquitin-protein ligase-like isoform 2-T2 [Clarias gariepinus]
MVSDQALQEWRAIRAQQDQEYKESLLVDEEKELKKLAYQASEEKRQKAIETRRQRMAMCNEPSDGALLKFKYPDGHISMRKFNLSESIQDLFDFVGQEDMASEIFEVQEATSSKSIKSSSSGSILDHGIKAPSTLYVLWLSHQDVQEILSHQESDGMYALQHASPGQPLLPESTIQPPMAVPSSQPLLTLCSTEPRFSVPSILPPLPESSTQPLLPVHSSQPPVTSHQSQGSETLFFQDEEPLTASPAQEPIIILDEQEEPVSQNLSPQSLHDLKGPVNEIDLQTILKKLVSKVDGSSCPTSNQINVCRNNIFLGSLRAFKRRHFNPEAKLDVVFVDEDDNAEGAVDEGGPTREYLRLLMRAIHESNVFEGHEKNRQLCLDTQALQTKLYTVVGKMIAVCVVHGGVGPHFFSERLFQKICGLPTPPTMIKEAMTTQEANSAIAEAADSLSIIGALRHVSSLEEKDSLVQSAADFFVNGRMQTALDQFLEGLRTLSLLDELRRNPAIFYNMFVNEERPLQAKDLCTLFEVDFSVQGSSRRVVENMTICFWRDWLIDIEEGECSPITLEQVLEFTSGASTVPPLGFPHRPQIQFLHEVNKIFPEANTCHIILRLPIHNDYDTFKKYMIEGIIQAPGFGVA